MAPDIEFNFPTIPTKTEAKLTELHPRARTDYEQWKQNLLDWLATEGKKPATREGLARSTVRKTSYQTGIVMRWLWDERGYTTQLRPDDADKLMRELGRYSDYESAGLNNIVKTLKRIFKYRNYQKGTDIDWSCEFKISEPKVTNRDYFTQDEFRPLYEAALSHGTVKHYHSCTPTERERVKGMLARRYDKPKSDVTPHDFERANSFKIPSLVGAALDMGLRPIEVERAKPDWFHTDERVVRIPSEESSKNRDNWECVLSRKAARAIDHWLTERQSYEEYATTDAMWLNDSRNPYSSKSLNYLLRKLIERAGIEPAGRDLTWYSIRHGVATVWVENEELHDAREQLRHVRVKTTLGYSHSSTKRRRGAADTKY